VLTAAPADYRRVGVTTGCYDDGSGWSPGRHPPQWQEGCWNRTEKDRHLLLGIDFHTAAFSPEPD
jgi:hypothetical protein